MIDFEKLIVNKKAKEYNKDVISFLNTADIDKVTNNQLRGPSLSRMLNIAEETGRFTKRNRRNFYVISRGSVFECVATFDYLHDIKKIDKAGFDLYYNKLDELSRILFSLIRSIE
ncbi:MAG: four helix bundle protein [Marinilabiliales bacterium]|nr:MAG: four helix bundle protein [Marinilabiliales bacterium]